MTFLNKEEANILTGYEAESVTLKGVVSKERAAVRWLKDWTPIEGDRFHTGIEGNQRFLTINPLRRSDAGEYTCDASTDEMHFSLLVKGNPCVFTLFLKLTGSNSESPGCCNVVLAH